jgi:hypothetical protein
MFSVSDDIDVERSAEEAFDFMADIRHENDWNNHIKLAALATSEPIGRGTSFHVVRKGSGLWRMEITVYDRPNRLVYIGRFRGGEFTYDARFTPTPSGTRIAGVIEMRLFGLMKLLAPMMRSRLEREMPEENANFKRAVERWR